MFNFGPGGHPKLTGKAAEIRRLGLAILRVWKEGYTVGDFHPEAIL